VNLTTVNLPQGVTNIDTGGGWFPDAFQGCARLTDLMVDLANSVYSSLDGVVYDKSGTALVRCPPGKPGSYSILNGVIRVRPGAFSFCTSLASVHVPDSVLDIHGAFSHCPALTSIAIGGSVTNTELALYGCSNLTWVTLQNGIRRIGPGTFEGCTRLKTITIPESVTAIEEGAFRSCTTLRSICFEGDAPSVPTWPQGVLFNTEATVCYLPGSIGWSATFCGRPTAVWLPQILSADSRFGVRDKRFGFTTEWARGKTVVIEAATSLANPAWLPVSTNTLVEGPYHFSDADWTNYPARFYRVREQ
jgi:hypothetical protein